VRILVEIEATFAGVRSGVRVFVLVRHEKGCFIVPELASNLPPFHGVGRSFGFWSCRFRSLVGFLGVRWRGEGEPGSTNM